MILELLLALFIFATFWLIYRNGELILENKRLKIKLTAVSEVLTRYVIKEAIKPKHEHLEEMGEHRDN